MLIQNRGAARTAAASTPFIPSSNCAVIVSFYDARSSDNLRSLLVQLADIDAGAPFDPYIVVNQTQSSPPCLPPRFSHIPILARMNEGFNVGAWQHAWMTLPAYEFYIFLQDECIVRRRGWAQAYINVLRKKHTGFVGESLSLFPSWERCRQEWPAIAAACERLGIEFDIPLGQRPDHIQTLAVGATRSLLVATGGFVTANEKVDSMAGEILTSVRAMNKGYRCRQVSFRPFEYFRHPQWDRIRSNSRTLSWTLSRLAHLYMPTPINRTIRRTGTPVVGPDQLKNAGRPSSMIPDGRNRFSDEIMPKKG